MKKVMNTTQKERAVQEKAFKRMMLYQKRIELTIQKRMNLHSVRKGKCL